MEQNTLQNESPTQDQDRGAQTGIITQELQLSYGSEFTAECYIVHVEYNIIPKFSPFV